MSAIRPLSYIVVWDVPFEGNFLALEIILEISFATFPGIVL